MIRLLGALVSVLDILGAVLSGYLLVVDYYLASSGIKGLVARLMKSEDHGSDRSTVQTFSIRNSYPKSTYSFHCNYRPSQKPRATGGKCLKLH